MTPILETETDAGNKLTAIQLGPNKLKVTLSRIMQDGQIITASFDLLDKDQEELFYHFKNNQYECKSRKKGVNTI